jgi:exosome complex protein LRP1
MDVPDITPDLVKLDGHLSRLDEALKPLLGDLSDTASQLPLLDRAKLYLLTAYTIESLLFG